jgi:hypothetical protein
MPYAIALPASERERTANVAGLFTDHICANEAARQMI